MTEVADRLESLDKLTLKSGAHASFDAGACAMEAVAWLAGETHSDHPACACPVVSAAVRRLNDRIGDDKTRTELLLPLLPKLVGSVASREVKIKRWYVAADMACRVFAPLALEKRGRLDLAAKLRALTEVTDRSTAEAARKECRSAAAAAYAYDAYAAVDAAAAADEADAAAAAAYAAADDAADRERARREVYVLGVQMIERMLSVTE